MLHYVSERARVVRGSLGLICLLLVVVFALGTARPAFADVPTTVYVVLLPDPNIAVVPGGQVEYTLRAANVGEDDASFVFASLSYDPEQLTLLGTRFEDERDWVSDRSMVAGREEVEVTFLDLGDGESRAATLVMQVNETLPQGSVISAFGKFTWIDINGQRIYRTTNAAPVLVSLGNASSPQVWMGVEPQVAPRNTIQSFYSDRFLPNETVVFWLNRSDGTSVELNRETRVDESGYFTLSFDNSVLVPGDYQMVAAGRNSGLTAFVDFTVTP